MADDLPGSLRGKPTFNLGALGPSYWSLVCADITGEDGKPVKAVIQMKFKRVGSHDVLARLRTMNAVEDPTSMLMEVCVDWAGVVGDDGEALPFTEGNMRRIVNAGMAMPIIAALSNSLPKAKDR